MQEAFSFDRSQFRWANRRGRFATLGSLMSALLVVANTAYAQLAPPLLELHTSRLNAAGPIDLETIEETLYLGRDGKATFVKVL